MVKSWDALDWKEQTHFWRTGCSKPHPALNTLVTGAAQTMCLDSLTFPQCRRWCLPSSSLFWWIRDLARPHEWRCVLSPKLCVLGISFFACQEKHYSHMELTGATWILHLTLTPHVMHEQYEWQNKDIFCWFKSLLPSYVLQCSVITGVLAKIAISGQDGDLSSKPSSSI